VTIDAAALSLVLAHLERLHCCDLGKADMAEIGDTAAQLLGDAAALPADPHEPRGCASCGDLIPPGAPREPCPGCPDVVCERCAARSKPGLCCCAACRAMDAAPDAACQRNSQAEEARPQHGNGC
jgi:hypothetical protein